MATGCVSRDLVPSYDSCNELLFLLWDNYLLYTLTWCKCLERHPLSNKTRVGNEPYFTSHRASVVKTLDLLKKGTKQNRLCFFIFFILLFNYVKASGSSIFPRRASLLLYSSFLIEMHPAWQMLGWTGQSLRETTGTICYTRGMREKGNKKVHDSPSGSGCGSSSVTCIFLCTLSVWLIGRNFILPWCVWGPV